MEEERVFISGINKSDQIDEDKINEIEDIETADVGLAEIIDIQSVKSLLSDFYKLIHIPIRLNDLKGNVLIDVGWQDICTKFHWFHPEAFKHCIEINTKLSALVSPGEFRLYKCKNNLWDIVTPIMTGSQHAGYVFAGQFFFDDEPLDYELFRSQAEKYEFNEDEYITALEKVPRLSREAVETGMSFFMTFANMLSQLSYSNKMLAKSLAEHDALVNAIRKSEKIERGRSNELATVLDAVPAFVLITHDTQALNMTGNRVSHEWLHLQTNANLSKAAPEGERLDNYTLFKDGVEIPLADMPVRLSASLGKELRDYEFDIVYKDGMIRHLLGNAIPLRDNLGNPNGAVAAFIDVTERKLAEKSVQESETRFRTLAENSPDIITRFDSQFRHIYANPAAVESYGIPLDEIIGKTQGELGRENKKVNYWEERLEKTFVIGKTETIEYTILLQGKNIILILN